MNQIMGWNLIRILVALGLVGLLGCSDSLTLREEGFADWSGYVETARFVRKGDYTLTRVDFLPAALLDRIRVTTGLDDDSTIFPSLYVFLMGTQGGSYTAPEDCEAALIVVAHGLSLRDQAVGQVTAIGGDKLELLLSADLEFSSRLLPDSPPWKVSLEQIRLEHDESLAKQVLSEHRAEQSLLFARWKERWEGPSLSSDGLVN